MKTLRSYQYSLQNETIESQDAAGRYNPALELTYRDGKGTYTVVLDSGHSDDITVFSEREDTLVLSVNTGLPYISLQVFRDGELCGDMFLQEEGTIEVLGKDWEEKTSMYLCKCLYSWI